MDELRERIGILTARLEEAYRRLDSIEEAQKDALVSISMELKELNAHMNKGKGWAASMLILAGVSGAGLSKLLAIVFAK